MAVGDKVTIYVNPSSPLHVKSKGSAVFLSVFLTVYIENDNPEKYF